MYNTKPSQIGLVTKMSARIVTSLLSGIQGATRTKADDKTS